MATKQVPGTIRVFWLANPRELPILSPTGMQVPPASSLISIIQLSITPVILISGLGGIMIALTNRMARIVDRTRILAGQFRTATTPEDKEHLVNQLRVMWRRANIMRWSVTCTGASILVACLLIGEIFLSALLGQELSLLMVCLFGLSLTFLVVGLILFIRDLFISLVALEIEVRRTVTDR